MQQHPPHSAVLCKPLGGFINTWGVQTSFCSFPLFRIYLDGDPVSVGSRPQQSLPAAGASAEHPTKGPDPCATRLGASREGSIGGSGNATLRTLHALGLPSFSLELLSWEGPSRQLPINLAALDHVLGRCWESALERRLGKGEGGPCPESEEESSAPLGLNFSTLFRRSLKTRIVVSRARRLDSRAGAGLEQRRSQQLSLTRILWSSSYRNNTREKTPGSQEVFPTLVSGSGPPPVRARSPSCRADVCDWSSARVIFL